MARLAILDPTHMEPSRSKKYLPRWYQRPVSDLLNQALQFTLSTVLAAGQVLRNCRERPVALILAATMPLLVIACHCAARARLAARQPPHLREIVDELASIRIPTGRPVPNHAGTRLLYLKYGENDTWGIYLLDIASRKSRLVKEVVSSPGESEFLVNRLAKILGWSPDDRYFAYVRRRRETVVICDGNSGAEVGGGNLGRGRPVTTFAWLSAQRLLCSDGSKIFELSRSPGGWLNTPFYEAPQAAGVTNADPDGQAAPVERITSLAAYGGNAAVWQQDNALYVGERGAEPKELWRATNSALIAFSFSPIQHKFLLHCRDDKGEFLVDYDPGFLVRRDMFTNVVRLDTRDFHPRQITLINDGEGYAYLNHSDFSLSQLVVKINRSSPPLELPWQGDFRGFAINGLQLYATSSRTNEPEGIWKYDLQSGALDLLVSSVERPLKYATNAPVLEGYVTNAAEERLTYYLLQPTRPTRKQKHPLVIGIMGTGEPGYTWDRFAQTIANCGGYFVCLDRRSRDGGRWDEDASCAYDFLSKHFAVDTNKVYLLGVSGGAGSVMQLLKSRPNLWKGAILLSAHRFPTPDQMRVQTISLDMGALDVKAPEARAQLLKSQDELAAAGIRPILTLHPGAGHIVRKIAFEKERMKQIAAFIQQP